MRTTVQANVVRRLINAATSVGASPNALWGTAGLTNTVDDEVRVPTSRLYALWSAAARETSSVVLPVLLTEAITLEELGVFGFAIMTAPDAWGAMLTAAQLFPVITDSGSWHPEIRERKAVVRWKRAPIDCPGQQLSTEATLAHFVACTRQTLGAEPPLTRVSLRHAVAPFSRRALSEFFGCEIEVGASEDALEWNRSALEIVPRFANRAMHSHFVSTATKSVADIAIVPTCADRVRSQLQDKLVNGQPTMSEVARALGASARTLRRRLNLEGTSYRALLDGVRRDSASQLLQDPSASITNVALDLGFSDSTAFSRAYRRWHGEPPARRQRDTTKNQSN